MTNNKKGFTLIELLVVIAIIGILSAIGLVSLNGAREKARDAKRQSDLATIKSASALYYDDQTTPQYPCAPTLIGISSTTAVTSGVLYDGLANANGTTTGTKYLASIPSYTTITGGTNLGNGNYYYMSNGAAAPTSPASNCTVATTPATMYAFAVRMEGGTKGLYVLNSAGYGGIPSGSASWGNTLANYLCAGTPPAATYADLCQGTPTANGVVP